MKILSREQFYEADRRTLSAEGIPGEALMERAATRVFDWLHARLEGAPVPVFVFCGVGNNGGDGLVVARHLLDHGYTVDVFVVDYSQARSEDFLTNLKRLKGRKKWPEYLDQGSPLPEIPANGVIIDAIFGIGLNRPPDPWVADLIRHLNSSGAFVLSIDMPSGLYLHRVPEDPSAVVGADVLLTFMAPKLVFFLPQTGVFAERWEVLDIGQDPVYMEEAEAAYNLVGREMVRTFYRPRTKFSHKGTYGHALVLGGSHGKIGAVALAAKAALASGAGLVTACVPECGYVPLQAQLPEVMVLTTPGFSEHTELPDVGAAQVCGIGMGMGTGEPVQKAFLAWLEKMQTPVLLDADALNILSLHPADLHRIPGGSILTPHPGELKRLVGPWKDDFDKLEKALVFAGAHKCILVVKGAHTMVFAQGKGYVNTTGNPGMATAGSGDVLSGMITGLLAQGYEPLQAALLGVYLHGRAGDLGASRTGYEALTATEIISSISQAFLELSGPAGPDQKHTAGG
ncbi:NAD(P)H-hydrate dehydratase [Robiginitalea marina]|uniref:Bifunctional NAD(P)H-hydrate repair enzyme n=1 Tax=Robiginitalea marina TaxID=2954105 RepID=A0ABT1AVZ4_9FLAO|nr:NAD(P)H-hydrate dehydratase [Robiginitalea marina]MCO5723777.1 NAD(P)H-hydrate dehydratase [Robiginitalea marina]